MIPLRDENPSGSIAFITRGLILLNCAVFLYELVLGVELRRFMYEWGLVPVRLSAALGAGEESLAGPAATLVSSMFLHGGWLHLIGNMWYLWIFGDNIEDLFGSLRFLLFYVTAGIFAAMIHFLTDPSSRLPTVGASGAIAAVLGAYMVAFPKARVITLVPLFPFFQVMALPAVLMLGLWFLFQFFSGALALASTARGGGIAWWSHIAGFVFGLIAARILASPRRSRRAWAE